MGTLPLMPTRPVTTALMLVDLKSACEPPGMISPADVAAPLLDPKDYIANFDKATYDAHVYKTMIDSYGTLGHRLGDLVNSFGKAPREGDELWYSDGAGGVAHRVLNDSDGSVKWRPAQYRRGSTAVAAEYRARVDSYLTQVILAKFRAESPNRQAIGGPLAPPTFQ